MKRREVIAFLTAAASALALPSYPQDGRRPYRLGLLPDLDESGRDALRRSLAQRGWVDGRDFILVTASPPVTMRMVTSGPKRLAQSISADTSSVVRQKPDLILATSTAYASAAHRVSASVPIVMLTSGYPVEAGIAESLARPGKNVTGNSIYAGTGFWGKLVELLQEAKPSMRRITLLWDYVEPAFGRSEIAPCQAEVQSACNKRGLDLVILEPPADVPFSKTSAAIKESRADGLIVTSGWSLLEHRRDVMAFATKHALPVITDFRWPSTIQPYPLMVFSASRKELIDMTTDYVVRILQGTPAGSLPIYQPRIFELTLDLRTAEIIDLQLPQALRLRANEITGG